MRSDFQNAAGQREKAEVLNNERKLRAGDHEPTTFHQLAGVDQALEGGGRFAKVKYVTGSEPASQYPRLPASSPWASDPIPPEEPLGFAIDAMEPVGTAVGIARSEESAAIQREAHAKLQALLEQGILRRRKL